MNILKTTLAAGAVAAVALAGMVDANAAKIVVGNHHTSIVVKAPIHRAPVRVIARKPIFVGGWYADPYGYRSHAYFRANPRLRACFVVTQKGFHGRRHALMSATMCYGRNGVVYVVPGTKHFVRFL